MSACPQISLLIIQKNFSLNHSKKNNNNNNNKRLLRSLRILFCITKQKVFVCKYIGNCESSDQANSKAVFLITLFLNYIT